MRRKQLSGDEKQMRAVVIFLLGCVAVAIGAVYLIYRWVTG